MTPAPRSGAPWSTRLVFWLTLLLAGAALAAPPKLIVSHPSRGTLEDLLRLRDQGLLRPPDLAMHLVYETCDKRRCAPLRRFVKKARPRGVTLEIVTCAPGPDGAPSADCEQHFQRLFEAAAGILFPGGADIPPALYGEETALTTQIRGPRRHRFELAFLRRLLRGGSKGEAPFLDARPDTLVLGICLGMQSLNVALGGSLIQDIPSEVYGLSSLEQILAAPADTQHRSARNALEPDQGHRGDVVHRVRFEPAGRRALGLAPSLREPRVVSYHHQAVDRLGEGLIPWAKSLDGRIVEALGHARYPAVLGVQFHPERQPPAPGSKTLGSLERRLWTWISERLDRARPVEADAPPP